MKKSDKKTDKKTQNARPLPSVFYNTLSLAGTSLAALSLGLILFLMLLDAFAQEHRPYMGVIAFVILPAFLILGLLIALLGIRREHRRRARGESQMGQLPRIDLNDPAHLRAAVMISVGGVMFLLLSGFGSFKAYEYTDSDQFCGKMCHAVMKPEYNAYKVSPHSRVGCIKCHIGPGAEWFVRSKLSGAYQVYATLRDIYPRPIETPIKNLRPSRDTCEQCHWPEYFTGDKLIVHDYFAAEEGNDHWRLHLAMKIGGGGARGLPAQGIHWHTSSDIKINYVATDEKRLEIPWVRMVDADGTEKIFRSTEADASAEALAGHETRLMDCIDCHNRPTHHYNPPASLVNEAMSHGLIAADLPGVKGVLVELMGAEYETEDEALENIDLGLKTHYLDNYPELLQERAADIQAASDQAQYMFKTNIFPEMKVSWRDFPDHIGHLTTPGCFRCHDGLHETEQGEVISRDCNVCHTILAQEVRSGEVTTSLASVEYQHPEDIDQEWKYVNCSECHGE